MDIPKPPRLYEITDRLALIAEALIDNDGELTPEMEAALNELEGSHEQKLSAMCQVIANHSIAEGMYDGIYRGVKAEADRLCARRDAYVKSQKRLKGAILASLTRLGKERMEAGSYLIRLQINSAPSIEPADPLNPPAEFLKPGEFSASMALEYLKSKGLVPKEVTKEAQKIEGLLVSRGQHVRIQ